MRRNSSGSLFTTVVVAVVVAGGLPHMVVLGVDTGARFVLVALCLDVFEAAFVVGGIWAVSVGRAFSGRGSSCFRLVAWLDFLERTLSFWIKN